MLLTLSPDASTNSHCTSTMATEITWTKHRNFEIQVSFDVLLEKLPGKTSYRSLKRIGSLGNLPSCLRRIIFQVDSTKVDGGYYAEFQQPQLGIDEFIWLPSLATDGNEFLLRSPKRPTPTLLDPSTPPPGLTNIADTATVNAPTPAVPSPVTSSAVPANAQLALTNETPSSSFTFFCSSLGNKRRRTAPGCLPLQSLSPAPSTPTEAIQSSLSGEEPIIVIKRRLEAGCGNQYFLGTLPDPQHTRGVPPILVTPITETLSIALFKARVSKPPLLGLYEYVKDANENPDQYWTICPANTTLLALTHPRITPYIRNVAYKHILNVNID